ncbi:MAG: type II secretion system protein N [bacterium]
MIKYILAGLLVFLLAAIIVAPAGILDRLVSQTDSAELTHSRGSLWRGQADLLVDNTHLGQVNWDFNMSSLFRLQPTYAWDLTQSHWQLSGLAGTSLSEVAVDLTGEIDADGVNQWLGSYDITTGGHFEILPTRIQLPHNSRLPSNLTGQINWSGGPVRYTLSGLLSEANLPPLVAYLDMNASNEPQATVFASQDQTPLLIATLSANGYAKVGISKRFTQLLNNPWPGTDPDHHIVIQVEEKIF